MVQTMLLIKVLTEGMLIKFPFLNEKYSFTVCRIEPENNIHLILKVFADYKKLKLVIVGNWAYSKYGRDLKKEYSNYVNIVLLDPIYDQRILNTIRSNCFAYIHGHSAGGTNPSLVEAMYLRLAVVAYKVSFNIETTNNKALYFNNKNELTEILERLEKDHNLVGKIKNNMKEIANRKYVWKIIADKYASVL